MNRKKASILLIYTGGTIGMKQDPVDGTLHPFDFSHIISEVPELSKFALKIDCHTFSPLIDSSDVQPGLWKDIATLIGRKYDQYDGFVVLHGTDTMAYSASALSFMLENLSKPVIFTGSQLPIGALRTDGRENLISAVEIASAHDEEGNPMVPEVCIFFDYTLLRGNRATKVSSENFSAFRSPNLPPLAEAGISIRFNRPLIRRPGPEAPSLIVHRDLDTRVSILKIHPGLTPEVARYFLCSPGIRAVILETYGSGNAPAKGWFPELVREADRSGKLIVNVTQCLSGSVDMDLYATGKVLKDAGVVSGYDATTEAMLSKLFYILALSPTKEDAKKLLEKNLRGEISKTL